VGLFHNLLQPKGLGPGKNFLQGSKLLGKLPGKLKHAKDRKKALQRAWQIVGIGLIESLVVGILVINLFGIIRTEGYRTGSAQASIHYEPNGMVSFRSGHAL